MSDIWVSSDHHFFHKNVLKFCPESRPFDSVEEMNEELIKRHNSLVKPSDDWYCLGDFSFGNFEQTESVLERLNGNKYYIFGNHCKVMRNNPLSFYFRWMKNYAEIKVGKKDVILFHFPIMYWNKSHFGSLHLYGHEHGRLPAWSNGRSLDVGVDTNDLHPYNIRTLIEMSREVEPNQRFN